MTDFFDMTNECLSGESIFYVIMLCSFLDQAVVRILLYQKLIQDKKIEFKSLHPGMNTLPSMLQIEPDLFQKSKN